MRAAGRGGAQLREMGLSSRPEGRGRHPLPVAVPVTVEARDDEVLLYSPENEQVTASGGALPWRYKAAAGGQATG